MQLENIYYSKICWACFTAAHVYCSFSPPNRHLIHSHTQHKSCKKLHKKPSIINTRCILYECSQRFRPSCIGGVVFKKDNSLFEGRLKHNLLCLHIFHQRNETKRSETKQKVKMSEWAKERRRM